jgi:hypothetical protein
VLPSLRYYCSRAFWIVIVISKCSGRCPSDVSAAGVKLKAIGMEDTVVYYQSFLSLCKPGITSCKLHYISKVRNQNT